MNKLLYKILFVLTIVIGLIVLFFLGAWVFMWLWNYVIPNVFGLPKIKLLQSAALLVLSSFIFIRYNGK